MKAKPKSLAKKNTACRYCGSNKLTRFLSLGDQPPSNSFISPEKVKSEKRYPLDVYLCRNCFLVQLIDVVPAEIIFDDYLYLSSSSKALKEHYASLAQTLTKRFKLKVGDVIVDIGCNDGILLEGYLLPGLIRLGVEPSEVAKIAIAAGFEVYKAFFGIKTASEIVREYKTAKVVTATNVFAHVDDIGSFVAGLPTLLGNDGVFVIEAPYLIDLIDETYFDTIYHEHLCYLSLTPMVQFLKRFGLQVFDVERIPFGASGPAIRVFIQTREGKQLIEKSVKKMLSDERKWGVGKIKNYFSYARKVEKIKKDVLELMQKIRLSGAQMGGYGAPAKGNTLLNYFGITPNMLECIAETNTAKQGLLTPGSHIPIVSEKKFLRIMPEYALLLSWNYLDFFLKNSKYIKKGGKFLVPLPKPKIAP
jgi:hypothetical protein